MKPYPLLAICLLLGLNCDTSTPTQTETVWIGQYHYTAYDSTETAVIIGKLNLSTSGADDLIGSWQLQSINNPPNMGPQTGQGILSGAYDGDSLWVSLNPQSVDSNVFLMGAYHADHLTGRWEWITFSGITNRGRFEAVKD